MENRDFTSHKSKPQVNGYHCSENKDQGASDEKLESLQQVLVSIRPCYTKDLKELEKMSDFLWETAREVEVARRNFSPTSIEKTEKELLDFVVKIPSIMAVILKVVLESEDINVGMLVRMLCVGASRLETLMDYCEMQADYVSND